MNTPNWFKGRGGQSLDELVNSLPVLIDPEDPDNRAGQALVLPVEVINGILHAQYVHDRVYTEKLVGFSYRLGEIEHTFSLSDKYERIPIREGSVVIPLTAFEDGPTVNIDPSGNPIEERVLHPLGIKIDDKNIIPLFIHNKNNPKKVISLCAEPEYNYLTYAEDDIIRPIEDAVKPIQIAQFRQYTKINAFRRGFLAGRDFAVNLTKFGEKGGSLDDVVEEVKRGIPPHYRQYRAQDDKLVEFALIAGMFSHPIHVFRGLFNYAGFNELGQRLNEFVRARVLPIAGVGISLALFLNVVAHAVRINYTEQPEPSRIRGKLLPISQEPLEKELKSLEPFFCQPVQFVLSNNDKDQYHFKGDFHEKSIVFYETLSARGYFPAPYAMRALRALNGGRSYELGVVEGQERRILTYIADADRSPFTLAEAYSSKPSRVSLFVMDKDGVIDYFITLSPEDYSCLVLKPYHLIYGQWLQGGYQWEKLSFAQMQKSVSRVLEKIERNPNYNLLRPVK